MIENQKIKIKNVFQYICKLKQSKKEIFKKQKESKHNKKRQNKTIIIFKHEKIPKKQLSLLLAKKLSTKKYRTVIINLTDNETNKNKYKEIYKKQKLIEKELEKYQKAKMKSNLLKKLKIKNNKENNKINYIKNNNKIKKE